MESTIGKTLYHVRSLVRHLDKCNPRGVVVVMLMELGMPTKLVGFEFLKRAIKLQRKDPTRVLAKDIYMELALHYRQNSEFQVEQAIREAIKASWRHGSREAWDWYFSYDGKPVTNKPTNSEFITRLAYILEIWQEYEITRGDCDERE